MLKQTKIKKHQNDGLTLQPNLDLFAGCLNIWDYIQFQLFLKNQNRNLAIQDIPMRASDSLYFKFMQEKNPKKKRLQVFSNLIENGKNYMVVTTIRDISEWLELVKEKNLTLAKTQAFASAAHEFRNPLSAIVNSLDLLKDYIDHEQASKYYMTAKNCSNLMLYLVNDILDYSQLESQKLLLNIEDTDIKQLIEECITVLRFRSDHKNIELNYEIDGTFPESFLSDQNRVRQILINLISNAIKYTNEGYIKVHCYMDLDDGMLNIEVEDSGVGIDEDEIKLLFNAYVKNTKNRSLNKEGCGLGLTISKNLAKALGGDIKVRSQVDQGSVFTLVLPFNYQRWDINIIRRQSNKLQRFLLSTSSNKSNRYAYPPSNRGNSQTSLHVPQNHNRRINSLSQVSNKYQRVDFETPKSQFFRIQNLNSQTDCDVTSQKDDLTQVHQTDQYQIQGRKSLFEKKQQNQESPHRHKNKSQYSCFREIPHHKKRQNKYSINIINDHSMLDSSRDMLVNSPKIQERTFVNRNSKIFNNQNRQIVINHESIEIEDTNFASIQIKTCSCPKILIADDDPFNIIGVEGMIQSKIKDANIEKVFNGRDALDKIAKRFKQLNINSQRNSSRNLNNLNDGACLNHEPYKLLLFDNQMPLMSGIQVAQELRQKYSDYFIKYGIKLVMISGDNYYSSDDEFKQLFDYIVTKPITMVSLTNILRSSQLL
ncbi:histidine kinase-dna gyrase b-and hsp90-like domain containing protein [Stylonychia lemnae]|uniref:Histidine kinase-dna gyrase b-and hsp90-like domain containing protein n=1 Tax=Stylonychia lemnae TaxID=5949 RepID=A0A078AQC7_STYLE|nr:histidine kinase-dna gyrase b-and hsp90-like domain containing protein [Stylonychia lemnae]|eukprot:CDW83148.1 histidine kinase-dna gyrase b-and hsp90-like domain containing protein [Stylonychia lemnae]